MFNQFRKTHKVILGTLTFMIAVPMAFAASGRARNLATAEDVEGAHDPIVLANLAYYKQIAANIQDTLAKAEQEKTDNGTLYKISNGGEKLLGLTAAGGIIMSVVTQWKASRAPLYRAYVEKIENLKELRNKHADLQQKIAADTQLSLELKGKVEGLRKQVEEKKVTEAELKTKLTEIQVTLDEQRYDRGQLLSAGDKEHLEDPKIRDLQDQEDKLTNLKREKNREIKKRLKKKNAEMTKEEAALIGKMEKDIADIRARKAEARAEFEISRNLLEQQTAEAIKALDTKIAANEKAYAELISKVFDAENLTKQAAKASLDNDEQESAARRRRNHARSESMRTAVAAGTAEGEQSLALKEISRKLGISETTLEQRITSRSFEGPEKIRGKVMGGTLALIALTGALAAINKHVDSDKPILVTKAEREGLLLTAAAVQLQITALENTLTEGKTNE